MKTLFGYKTVPLSEEAIVREATTTDDNNPTGNSTSSPALNTMATIASQCLVTQLISNSPKVKA